MKRVTPWTILLSIAAASGVAEAQSLTRGPYLQQGGSTRVTVRWRTSTATNSRVRWGTTSGALTSVKDDAASVTDHVVTLTGLSPDTTYFYSVGSTTASLAGGDANHFFVTSPVVGTPKPTRVWVLGDAGTKDANQRAVRDAYTAFTGTRHTDLWLMLGDNAYSDGTDAEYQAAVYDMYPAMLRKSVLWSTFGNHDGHTATSSTQSGPYYDMFTFPKAAEIGGAASGTEAYYAFDYANVHFVSLDSEGTSRSATGAMANWLKADLASTSQEWLVVLWHHPPYTKGSHDSDTETALKEMRQNFNPILEGAGVDLVLCGHSHSYERSFLINGHYGLSSTFSASHKIDGGSGRDAAAYEKPAGLVANKGAVYAVAGSSGKVSGGSLNHPAMYISLNQLGSMVLDVAGPRMDVKFLRETGAVADYFTLLKGTSSGDTAAPAVQITTPTSASTHTTSTSPLSLGGTASDNVGVTNVTWSNAATGGTGTASGTTSWTASIGLAAGSNAITVRAQDAAGNFATDLITVTYNATDVVNPSISITTPTTASTHSTSATPLALGGTASDNVGVTLVTWSNAATGGTGTAGGTTSWTASIGLAAGSNAITVKAKDAAGNQASDTITVTYTPGDATAPLISITTPTSSATHATSATPLALGGTASDNVGVTLVTWSNAATGGTGTAGGTTSWTASIALAAGSNAITVKAKDAAGNQATDTITVTYTPPPGDTTDPTLTIVSPSSNPFAATSEPLEVSGGAADDVAVATVTWSNAATGETGTAAGTTTWSASIPLAAGANAITITAVDTSGNDASTVLNVTYGTAGGPVSGGDGENGDHAINDKCAGSIAAPGWAPLWLLGLLFFRPRRP